ncbi:UDP-N-acetylmuramoyl-tripeptide--D-alanyl-D- alanine ligase [Chlamydiales bacterium STE3]|nr:UDP-N-acetylmuramoyl-tripeptide--D-alanyl-D- alanine ligase [Chlamydiales bacterium STE3]
MFYKKIDFLNFCWFDYCIFMKKIETMSQLNYVMGRECSNNYPICGFSVDARTIQQGQVFFAIPGERVDGHQFVQEALAKGAACAVVEKSYPGDGPLIRVDHVLRSLQQIVKALLSLRKTKIIGITGSVGKTSTKEFLSVLLEKNFVVGKSAGNQNSQIGLPLTILNDSSGDEELLILEMGMTQPGQIASLTEIAPPTIALITQVALVHAANFPSIDAILQAKLEIFNHPKTQITIGPYEWKRGTHLFSLDHHEADYFFDGTHLYEAGRMLGALQMPISGKHYQQNILSAIAVACQLGLEFQEIQERLKFLKLFQQRFETKLKKGVIFIDDSYNASAIAVKAALSSLPTPRQGRFKFAVLGSMLELGKFSAQCHIDVAEEALKTVDYLFCYGEECLPMIDAWHKHGREAHYFDSHQHLISELRKQASEGDIVLVKGSYGNAMWKVIEEF